MKFTVKNGSGHRVPTVSLSGKISPGEERSLRKAVLALLDQGHRKIFLNLGGLSKIDSRGIDGLFSCCSEAQNEGAEITFLWSH